MLSKHQYVLVIVISENVRYIRQISNQEFGTLIIIIKYCLLHTFGCLKSNIVHSKYFYHARMS